jgi:hypothetical protein
VSLGILWAWCCERWEGVGERAFSWVSVEDVEGMCECECDLGRVRAFAADEKCIV